MLLATAIAILVLTLIAAGIFWVRSYHPTRVPVVELAVVPRDMRAKVRTHVRLRLRVHQQRRASRSRPPTTPPEVASVSAPDVASGSAPVTAPNTTSVRPAPPHTPPLALIQASRAHKRSDAPPPGSYFRVVDAPSTEAIVSDVRGPWAAGIVTPDGRITLPDNGADVTLPWRGAE